jgi:spore maturation protein A
MMNWIWAILIALSVVCGIMNGRIAEVSKAALSGSGEAVTLFIMLLGVICLWNGIMKIADSAGLTKSLGKLLSPILRLLFPKINPKGEGAKAISMNIAANLMGLGNAATPLGLAAMKELEKQAPKKGVATNAMVTFVVLNTASLQIIPTTIAVLRSGTGSKSPFEIMPAIWVTSIISLIAALSVNFFLARFFKE